MEKLNWKPVPRPGPVTLRGRYVTLEPVDAELHGQPIWNALNGHDELWAYLPGSPSPSAAEMVAERLAWQQANEALTLAILPQEGEPVGDAESGSHADGMAKGWASFMRMEPAHGVIEVGNILFSPALQRTRAATEAMYLMAGHVFDHLGYRRYEWKCNALNEPSRRAALRLGFIFEGVFRQHMVVKNKNRDTAWFSMLDKEWPARKRAFEAWLDPRNFDEQGRQRTALAAAAARM